MLLTRYVFIHLGTLGHRVTNRVRIAHPGRCLFIKKRCVIHAFYGRTKGLY